MTFWHRSCPNPKGNKSFDEFTISIDKIPKIVFSCTLKNSDPLLLERLPLFKIVKDRVGLKLLKTKTFRNDGSVLYGPQPESRS